MKVNSKHNQADVKTLLSHHQQQMEYVIAESVHLLQTIDK